MRFTWSGYIHSGGVIPAKASWAWSALTFGPINPSRLLTRWTWVSTDLPLKKGIPAKDRGENKSPHSEQHSAVSSFWFRYITRMSVKQLGGLVLRSLHTRAFPSGSFTASGLLAGHGRRNSCLQVPGSLSPQPTRDRR